MLGYWNCNNIFVWYCSLLQLENPSIHWWVAIASSHSMAAVVGNLKCIFFGQSQEFWLSANQFLQKTIFSFTSSKSENYSMHCRRVKGFVVRGACSPRETKEIWILTRIMKYRGHHKLAGLIMMLMMIGNWEEEEKHNTKENWSLE